MRVSVVGAVLAALFITLYPSPVAPSHSPSTAVIYTLPNGKTCTNSNSHHPIMGHDYFRASFTDYTMPDAGANSSLTVQLEYYETDTGEWSALSWDDLIVMHSRKLHVICIGQDLDTFLHVHPDDFYEVPGAATTFTVYNIFPRGGLYVVALDFAVNGDRLGMCVAEEASHYHARVDCPSGSCTFASVTKLLYTNVTSTSQDAMAIAYPYVKDMRFQKTFSPLMMTGDDQYIHPITSIDNERSCCPDGDVSSCYTALLEVEKLTGASLWGKRRLHSNVEHSKIVLVGDCLHVSVQFLNASSGAAATLGPYLNAEAHFVLVHEDLETVQHLHGMSSEAMQAAMSSAYSGVDTTSCVHWHDPTRQVPEEFGPGVVAMGTITRAGTYKLFVTTTAESTYLLNPSFFVLASDAATSEDTEEMAPCFVDLGSCDVAEEVWASYETMDDVQSACEAHSSSEEGSSHLDNSDSGDLFESLDDALFESPPPSPPPPHSSPSSAVRLIAFFSSSRLFVGHLGVLVLLFSIF